MMLKASARALESWKGPRVACSTPIYLIGANGGVAGPPRSFRGASRSCFGPGAPRQHAEHGTFRTVAVGLVGGSRAIVAREGAALDAVGADEQLRALRGDGERAEAHHREGGDRKGCQRRGDRGGQRDRERAETAVSAGLGAGLKRTVRMRRLCPQCAPHPHAPMSPCCAILRRDRYKVG